MSLGGRPSARNRRRTEADELVELFRAQTGPQRAAATDLACPTCGVEGYPDSEVNLCLFWCDECDSAYFVK